MASPRSGYNRPFTKSPGCSRDERQDALEVLVVEPQLRAEEKVAALVQHVVDTAHDEEALKHLVGQRDTQPRVLLLADGEGVGVDLEVVVE
jgi:hypothetical protein